MSESQLATAPVNPGFHKATSALANVLGIEPRMMIDTIKRQCFPGMNAENISDTQLAAFVSVAQATGLNPLVPGMLFAYPSRNGGIVPMTGPDGVFKILDEAIMSEKLTGFECVVFPEDVAQKPTHAVATIWRKGTDHPSNYTAIFQEWVVGNNPNWQSRPRHMIWLRAIKQCARQVIHGIPYDDDEAEIGGMKNVTPAEQQSPPPKNERHEPKPRKGAAAAKEAARTTEVVVEQEPATPDNKREREMAADAEPKNVTPEPEAPKTVEQPKPAPVAASATPRVFLKDGERLIANVEIVSVDPVGANAGNDAEGKPLPKIPSVVAMVKGDYNNEVQHKGGGKMDGDKFVSADPWVKGARVTLHLLGRLSVAKTGPKVGKVLAIVEKALATPVAAPVTTPEEF